MSGEQKDLRSCMLLQLHNESLNMKHTPRPSSTGDVYVYSCLRDALKIPLAVPTPTAYPKLAMFL